MEPQAVTLYDIKDRLLRLCDRLDGLNNQICELNDYVYDWNIKLKGLEQCGMYSRP